MYVTVVRNVNMRLFGPRFVRRCAVFSAWTLPFYCLSAFSLTTLWPWERWSDRLVVPRFMLVSVSLMTYTINTSTCIKQEDNMLSGRWNEIVKKRILHVNVMPNVFLNVIWLLFHNKFAKFNYPWSLHLNRIYLRSDLDFHLFFIQRVLKKQKKKTGYCKVRTYETGGKISRF